MEACGFTLIAIEVSSTGDAQARVAQRVITGIGGGAIIKTEDHVTGTATATSIWSTGAIGIAIVLSLLTFMALFIPRRFKAQR